MQTEIAPSLLCQGRGNFMKRHPLPLCSSAFICGYFVAAHPPGIVR